MLPDDGGSAAGNKAREADWPAAAFAGTCRSANSAVLATGEGEPPPEDQEEEEEEGKWKVESHKWLAAQCTMGASDYL